jgi:hypothetical protein
MARIQYSDPSKASDRTREILDKNRHANIFRMMAHGANDLAIGDSVVASFKPFAGKLVPFFTREP